MGERSPELRHAHLEARSVPGTPWPMTETGYRLHPLHRKEVDQAGCPAAYVPSWLGYMAQSAEWRSHCAAKAQLSSF